MASDDVAGLLLNRIALRLVEGARPRVERTALPGWRGGARARDGLVEIDPRHVRIHHRRVAMLIDAYLERPDLRYRLGTRDSLEWDFLSSDGVLR